jgi:hypothetical protein
MPTPRLIGLPAAALVLLLAAFPADASQAMQQTLRDLTLSSSDIVVGRVEGLRTHWDAAHAKIVTEVTVRVSQSLKGAARETVTLTQLGGDLDGFRYSVPGSPSFRDGQEALLFVWRDRQGRAQVNGLAQGKYDVRTDTATGRKTVQRELGGLGVRGASRPDAARTERPEPAQPLDDVLGQVRTILAEGGR